jgi:ATP-binding cassette subfamily B multidrug efflux pump
MNSMRKLLRYIKPYWKLALIGPILMLVEVAMDLMQPRLLQQIVDVGIARADLGLVIRTGISMVCLALIGAFGGTGNTVLAVRVSQGVGADLRSDLFRKVQSLSFGNLDKLKTGSIVTRLTNDVVQIQNVVLTLLRILVRAPLMLIGSLLMAIITSPRLALLLVALTPIVILALIWAVKKAHPMFMEVQRKLDGVNGVMQENLAGVRVVKAFVREKHETGRFRQSNDQLMYRTIKAVRLMAAVRPILMLALNFGIVAVIWFGGIQTVRGNIMVGQIMAFVNYLTQTLFSLMMVGMLLVHISRAEASAERILEVLDSEPAIKNRENASSGFSAAGQVEFDNVSFSYDGEGADPVLKGISFSARPGERVAILGATGSGKSTLVNLIPRFYDVTDGAVRIDGVDVRDVEKETLRRRIGTALQVPILFTGSARENICYGRPEAPEEEITAAAAVAQIHDFIRGLPEGYDTVIGQRGVNLSGGQKQRIALARALLTQPSILILDDCTSSVDLETESRIQQALSLLPRKCTCFVVAQRISSVITADTILVLEDGKISAQGKHDALLASSSIYREIYDSQLGDGRERDG